VNSRLKIIGWFRLFVRRRYFGESNESVLNKTVSALDAGLTPIVCVRERERKNAETVLTEQFRDAIGALSNGQFEKIIIAYEPIWAIGIAETATPEAAADAHRLIRAQAQGSFRAEAASQVASCTAAVSSQKMPRVLRRRLRSTDCSWAVPASIQSPSHRS
jgi:triosephosphate isomerase